jgi:hypothetical protein
MRLNCGEGNGVSLAGRTSQSIARIARITVNVAICRTFLRAVLYPAIARSRLVIVRPDHLPPAYRLHRNMAICRYFSFVMVTAVDAGDTFPSFT